MWMLRFRKIGVIALAAGLVLGGGLYGWKTGSFVKAATLVRAKTLAATAAAGFKVDDVIVTGRLHIERGDILKHLAVHQGDPIFGVSVEDAQKSLAEISWAKTVSVTRRLPDKIIINIVERQPAALWQYQKKLSVIDMDGRTLTDDGIAAYQSLPLVVGEDAPEHAAELLNMLQAEPAVASQVASAVRIGGRRWDLHLKNGMTVKLPEQDTELALARLAREEQQGRLFHKQISSIDLRMPDELVVEPVSAAGAGEKDKNKKTI